MEKVQRKQDQISQSFVPAMNYKEKGNMIPWDWQWEIGIQGGVLWDCVTSSCYRIWDTSWRLTSITLMEIDVILRSVHHISVT